MALPRNNAANDRFSILTRVGATPAEQAIIDKQKREFLKLRMKRTLADIVHDFSRPFLDSEIDIKVLIEVFLLTCLDEPTADEVNELGAYYRFCTTDAQAKVQYKRAKHQYLSKYNIPETQPLEVSLQSGDEEEAGLNDIDQLYNILKGTIDPVTGAASGVPDVVRKWYIDAQTGNPIKKYEQWREASYRPAAPPHKNNLCKDNANDADPATKWGGDTILDTIRYEGPQGFEGCIIGSGFNYGLLYDVAGNLHAYSLGADGKRILDRVLDGDNNSIESLKAQILLLPNATPEDKQRRILYLLAKLHGDGDQGNSASSTIWNDAGGREVNITYVSNDILEIEDKDDYQTRDMIGTGPTELKYYFYSNVPPRQTLTEEQSNRVRTFLGVPAGVAVGTPLEPYIRGKLTAIMTDVNTYFQTVIDSMRNGNTPRYVLRAKGAATPAGEVSIFQEDANKRYVVKFAAPGSKILQLAHLTGALIDLLEKCYQYTTMQQLIADINVMGVPADAGEISSTYAIFENDIKLRQYLGVHSFFKPKVIQSEINKIFSGNLTIANKDSIFTQLVMAFKKFVTVPNIPYNVICLFIVVAFMQLTMPPRVSFISHRTGNRGLLINNDIENRKTWIDKFFTSPTTHPFIRTILLRYMKGSIPNMGTLNGGRFFPSNAAIPSTDAYSLGDAALRTAIFTDAIFWASETLNTTPNITSSAIPIDFSIFEPFITTILSRVFAPGTLPPAFSRQAWPAIQNVVNGDRAVPIPGIPDLASVEDFIVKNQVLVLKGEKAPESVNKPTVKSIVNAMAEPEKRAKFFAIKQNNKGSASIKMRAAVDVTTSLQKNKGARTVLSAMKRFREDIAKVFRDIALAVTLPDRTSIATRLTKTISEYSSATTPAILSRQVLAASKALGISRQAISSYLDIGTAKMSVKVQRGGGEAEPSEDVDVPSGITNLIDAVTYLFMLFEDEDGNELKEPELDVHTFQWIVTELILAAIATDMDPNAHLLYAIAAVSDFGALRNPHDIIKGFKALKDHEYISNGFWETVPYFNIIDELAADFEAAAPSWTLETRVEQTVMLQDILKELTSEEYLGELPVEEKARAIEEHISYLSYAREDPRVLPDFNRLYALSPETMKSILLERISKLVAIKRQKPGLNVSKLTMRSGGVTTPTVLQQRLPAAVPVAYGGARKSRSRKHLRRTRKRGAAAARRRRTIRRRK